MAMESQTNVNLNASNVVEEERCWVRLAALSYDATAEHIHHLCNSLNLSVATDTDGEDPVIILLASARPSGMVIVHFESTAEAEKATSVLHGHHFGGRRIQCRQLSRKAVLDEIQKLACRKPAPAPGSDLPVGVDRRIKHPETFIEQERTGRCVKLVGIPFGSPVEEVVRFLLPYRATTLFFLTHNGRPTGNCIVEMEDGLAALRAVHGRHRRYIGSRFVEVYPARPCDLMCDATQRPIVIESKDLVMTGEEHDEGYDNVNGNQRDTRMMMSSPWHMLSHPQHYGVPSSVPAERQGSMPPHSYPAYSSVSNSVQQYPAPRSHRTGSSISYDSMEAQHSSYNPAPHYALPPAAPIHTHPAAHPHHSSTPPPSFLPAYAAPLPPHSMHTPYYYAGVDHLQVQIQSHSHSAADGGHTHPTVRAQYQANIAPPQQQATASQYTPAQQYAYHPAQQAQPGTPPFHTPPPSPSASAGMMPIAGHVTPGNYGIGYPASGFASQSFPAYQSPPNRRPSSVSQLSSASTMKREEVEASSACSGEDFGYMPAMFPTHASCSTPPYHPDVQYGCCTSSAQSSVLGASTPSYSCCAPATEGPIRQRNPSTPSTSSEYASDDSRTTHQPYEWANEQAMTGALEGQVEELQYTPEGVPAEGQSEHFPGCMLLGCPSVMRSSELIAWGTATMVTRRQ